LLASHFRHKTTDQELEYLTKRLLGEDMKCLEKAFAKAMDECDQFPVLKEILARVPAPPKAGPKVIWGQGGACVKDSLLNKNYVCGCRECRRQDWCAFEGCSEHLTHHSGKSLGLARLGAEGPDYCETHQNWENREADAQLPVRMPKPAGRWEQRAEELAKDGRAGFKQLLREIAASPGPLHGVNVGRVMRMKP
jgi:hypothetical protein